MALRLASRQLASLLPASRSGLCAFSTEQAQSKGKDEEESKPTYTYMSPGSSLREASYGISVNDPVYVVDPKPTQPKQAPTPPKQAATQQSKAAQAAQQAVSPPPPASKVRVGLKPDDFANQPYVTSPKGSMREPHYVSVSDPQDAPHLKK